MEFNNTIGTSMLQTMTIFQFIVLGFYSFYLHFFKRRLLRAMHHRPEQKDWLHRTISHFFRRGLSLALLRGIDLCTPAVFLLCHSLVFVSAADSAYTACGMLLLAFVLPFKFFEEARATRAELDPGDEDAEDRVQTYYVLGRTLAVCTFIGLYFIAPVARLEVAGPIATLINETDTGGPRVPSIDVPRGQLIVLTLLLVAPKRVGRSLWTALIAVPVIAGYFGVALAWSFQPEGEVGSVELAFTTVMQYSLRQWGGRVLVHVAVVFSSLMWIVNPLWESDFVVRKQVGSNDGFTLTATDSGDNVDVENPRRA